MQTWDVLRYRTAVIFSHSVWPRKKKKAWIICSARCSQLTSLRSVSCGLNGITFKSSFSFSQLSSSPPTAASLCSHAPSPLILLSCLKFPEVSHGTKMEQQLNQIGFNCARKMAAELRGNTPPINRRWASAGGNSGTWICIVTFSFLVWRHPVIGTIKN